MPKGADMPAPESQLRHRAPSPALLQPWGPVRSARGWSRSAAGPSVAQRRRRLPMPAVDGFHA
jgi:hypothetical protein